METLRVVKASQLRDRFLALDNAASPRVHLGCGQSYLEGYLNVDLPPQQHSLTAGRIDLCADLRALSFAQFSVGTVRNHHVFEHFDRATALGLLIEWYGWLKEDGVLMIETPDFERAVRRVFSHRSSKGDQCAALRHVFGSHEASWAYHLDGWYKEKFIENLRALGYRDIEVLQVADRMLDNILVKAFKRSPFIDKGAQIAQAEQILARSLVSIQYEESLFDVWKEKLHCQTLGVKSTC